MTIKVSELEDSPKVKRQVEKAQGHGQVQTVKQAGRKETQFILKCIKTIPELMAQIKMSG